MPQPTSKLKPLSDQQLMRYSRHIMLPSVDIDGQELMYNSKVLVIGLGGLGCAATQYLASSGVGLLTLVDDDEVDITNLQRQVLHGEKDLTQFKVHSARDTIQALNKEIEVECYPTRLNDETLSELISKHDVVLDCTDNLATRNQINKACFEQNTPLISGSAIRMEGQVSTFLMDKNAQTPCYQCLSQLFETPNLTCSEAGVLSPVVGIVGTIQATECLKLIANIGKLLSSTLLTVDAATMEFNHFKIPKNPQCDVCG